MVGATFEDSRVVDALASFVPVWVDGDAHGDVMRNLRIRGYPTTIFLDSDGREIDRIVGAVDADDFLRRLERTKNKLL